MRAAVRHGSVRGGRGGGGGLGLLLVRLLLLLLLLRVEGGRVLGLVGGGTRGRLTYQRRQGDGLAVLRGDGQVLRVRGVVIFCLAVGVRVGLVVGVLLVGRGHDTWVKGRGLHP